MNFFNAIGNKISSVWKANKKGLVRTVAIGGATLLGGPALGAAAAAATSARGGGAPAEAPGAPAPSATMRLAERSRIIRDSLANNPALERNVTNVEAINAAGERNRESAEVAAGTRAFGLSPGVLIMGALGAIALIVVIVMLFRRS